MPDFAASYRGVPVESAIPEDTAPLESILCTEELRAPAWPFAWPLLSPSARLVPLILRAGELYPDGH